jgi:hypothetical protein
MGRVLRAALFGIVGGIVLAVATFAAGFALASVVDPTGSGGMGALVPMVFMPLAFLVGLVGGAWRGWRCG